MYFMAAVILGFRHHEGHDGSDKNDADSDDSCKQVKTGQGNQAVRKDCQYEKGDKA